MSEKKGDEGLPMTFARGEIIFNLCSVIMDAGGVGCAEEFVLDRYGKGSAFCTDDELVNFTTELEGAGPGCLAGVSVSMGPEEQAAKFDDRRDLAKESGDGSDNSPEV